MSAEVQFDQNLNRMDIIIRKFIGINLRVTEESRRNKRKYRQKFVVILIFTLAFDAGGLIWLLQKALTGMTFDDTDTIPKLIISVMSTIKLLLMHLNERDIGNLLTRMKEIQKDNQEYVNSQKILHKIITKELEVVNAIAKTTFYCSILTLSLFMISPLVLMPYSYWKKGEFSIYAPMTVSYVFCDSFDLVGWLISYLHTAFKGVRTIIYLLLI